MRAHTRSLTLTALVVVLLATAVPSAVATESETELQEHIDAATIAQQEVQTDLGSAESRLAELEADFQLTVDDHNIASEELAELEVEVADHEEEVERFRGLATTARSEVGRSARGLYVAGLKGGLPGLVGGSQASELTRRLAFVEAARTSRLTAIESYASDQRRYEASLELLESARDEADAKREEVASLQAEIEGKIASQEDEIAHLQAEIARQAALRAERERRLVAVRAERARSEAAARAERRQAELEAAEKAAAEQQRREEAASSKAAVAVQTALAQVGKPYQWGGSGPSSFDCSGLTGYAWRAAGVSLPHNSRMQYSATTRVSSSDLRPGDLLFFYSPISHVGIYIGDGRMVDAPYSGKSVRVRSVAGSGYHSIGRPRY